MENINKVYAQKMLEEYSEKKDNKAKQLQKLDKKVKKPAITIFIITLTIGLLTLGTGMSMIMTDFGFSGDKGLILGIIIGIIGLIISLISYPLYVKILNIRRKKYKSLISTLASEIIQE